MKENLQYFESTTTIDLRNCKFQGQINSKHQWHGFGIVLDDDMTICASQWDSDQLNGETFIIKMNGSLLFGQCKNNNLDRMNVFKNDGYSILSCFSEGKPKGKSAAFDKTMTNALIFNSQQITSKRVSYQPFCTNFVQIMEIRKQKEIIQNVAKVNQIETRHLQLEFLQFLRKIYQKYDKILTFIKRDRGYFFGFKSGIGFQFQVQGNVHEKIQLLSVGIYGKTRVLQVGVKLHNKRCFQQGKFHSKQTITYSNLLDRPQKCKQVYQKAHKLSLNFTNKYFYLKDSFLNIFQDFITKKLDKQFHQAVSLSHERKKFKIQQQQETKKNEKARLKFNQMQLWLKYKITRDKSLATKSTQFEKETKTDKKRYFAQKQNRRQYIIKNKSLIDLKPKQKKQQYVNNFKEINKKRKEANLKLPQNQPQQLCLKQMERMQTPRKQIYLVTKEPYNFAQNSQKLKPLSKQKSITRINQQKIRQQLYVNELKLEKTPLRVASQLINQTYLYQLSSTILPPKTIPRVELNPKAQFEFQQQFLYIQHRRAKLLNDFKKLNQNYDNKNSMDGCSQINQSNQKTLSQIQPPIFYKQNADLGLRYSDRFRSRNDPAISIKRNQEK